MESPRTLLGPAMEHTAEDTRPPVPTWDPLPEKFWRGAAAVQVAPRSGVIRRAPPSVMAQPRPSGALASVQNWAQVCGAVTFHVAPPSRLVSRRTVPGRSPRIGMLTVASPGGEGVPRT